MLAESAENVNEVNELVVTWHTLIDAVVMDSNGEAAKRLESEMKSRNNGYCAKWKLMLVLG